MDHGDRSWRQVVEAMTGREGAGGRTFGTSHRTIKGSVSWQQDFFLVVD
jgi:hypothetical protein